MVYGPSHSSCVVALAGLVVAANVTLSLTSIYTYAAQGRSSAAQPKLDCEELLDQLLEAQDNGYMSSSQVERIYSHCQTLT